MTISLDVLNKHWPKAIAGLNSALTAAMPDAFATYDLISNLRVAHFMAQVSVECGAGTVIEENLNYSAERIAEVWPKRFPTVLAAQPYAHNPKGLANKVYNGRMGNQIGTDDGWNFRGRGIIQITGRSEYDAIGKIVGWDLVDNPEMATDLVNLLDVACADLRTYPHIYADMDADDCEAVTLAINGGYEGLTQRKAWLGIWKAELGL